VLLVAQSEKVGKCGRLQWHKVYTKFNENPSTGQNAITVRQMCKHDETQVHTSLQTKKRRLKTGEF